MKKKLLFLVIVSITIASLIFLTSILNIVALKNNYVESTANNNAIVSSGVVNKLEYSLKYGKSLENYYGIDDLFSDMKVMCEYIDDAYIVRSDKKILYSKNYNNQEFTVSDSLNDYLTELQSIKDNKYLVWVEDDEQNILLPIRDINGGIIAGLGISYDTGMLSDHINVFVDKLTLYTIFPILIGVFLFVILFFIVKHNFEFKKLIAMVIPVVIISNVIFGIASYTVYKSGYVELTKQTSDTLGIKIQNDITSIVNQGIPYAELNEIDVYFDDILKNTDQIESIQLVSKKEEEIIENNYVYELKADKSGKPMYLRIKILNKYLEGKLNAIIIEILASIVTSMMIATEVIIFILSILTTIRALLEQRKQGTVKKINDETIQPIGIVRGLFFFFAMFQYMSMAFVPIVMAEIYKPIFGLPYEIVMGIPITMQILVSIISAWFCGKLVNKKGWRPVAVTGMLIMVVGTIIAAFSKEPIMFIGAQIVLGLGLGCSKTAFDIFGVLTPSSDKLEEYTSSTNAGLIVGMSCSAAIGAVIADVVGFSSAFLVMGAFGIFVIIMVMTLSINVIEVSGKIEKEENQSTSKKQTIDYKYISYILMLIVPYFFISMYLDYFFPVYADANGMSTANIGHVFLLYGISTSYIGAFMCKVLSKKIRTVTFMSLLLLILAAFMGFFAVKNSIIYAVAFVLLIAVVDGIMPSLQYRYVFSLDIAKNLGISRAIGIEGAFSSAIRGVAPIVFGFAMIYGNSGILVASIAVFAAAILFAFVNYILDKKGEVKFNEMQKL